MSFQDTRAQRKHLALDGLRRDSVRKVGDFGAEVRVGRGLGGPARRLADWPRFEVACSTTPSAGPTRRPRVRGRRAPRAVY